MLDWDPVPPQKMGHSPQLWPMSCGQTVGWIKMTLEVGLSPGLAGHIVLDGDPAPPQRGTAPEFSAHVYCGQTVAHLSYC